MADNYYGPGGYGVPPYSDGKDYSTSSGITVYPCDRGTGSPVGYHKFSGTGGIVVCEYCGKGPS